MSEVLFSLVIPVYNRPGELSELLASLTAQAAAPAFEVVVVEDGSSVPCADVCRAFAGRLAVRYLCKPNGGPGPARNFGAAQALGRYVLILDSDVVLPPGYLAACARAVERADAAGEPLDAFGGPDAAHPDFTPTQKAISYSMTAFLTTGGIRGGRRQMERFHPRSFNMGVLRAAYTRLGGFAPMRFGEDVDFSMRIFEAGLRCRLVPEAWVWHKRRTDMRKFFKQVHNSGIARINLYRRHPDSLKLVHLLPMLFTLGTALLLLTALVGLLFGCPHALWTLAPLVLYALLVMADATRQYRSPRIGLLAVRASFTQLIGYGTGFLRAWYLRCVRGRNEELQAFKENFYE